MGSRKRSPVRKHKQTCVWMATSEAFTRLHFKHSNSQQTNQTFQTWNVRHHVVFLLKISWTALDPSDLDVQGFIRPSARPRFVLWSSIAWWHTVVKKYLSFISCQVVQWEYNLYKGSGARVSICVLPIIQWGRSVAGETELIFIVVQDTVLCQLSK